MSRSRIWPASHELDALIENARRGCPVALGQLLDACRDYLLLVANREMGNDLRGKVGASDVVQDSFVQAQRGFVDFQGTSESELLGWLRRILINQVLGVRRRYSETIKRELGRELSCDEPSVRHLAERVPCKNLDPSQQACVNEEVLSLYEVLELLPAEYRQIIVLRYWEGLSFDEIGKRTGQSTGTVRKSWFRAVERMKLRGSSKDVKPK